MKLTYCARIDENSLSYYQRIMQEDGMMFSGAKLRQVLASAKKYSMRDCTPALYSSAYTSEKRILPHLYTDISRLEQSKRNHALWRKVQRMRKITSRALELIHCGKDPSWTTHNSTLDCRVTVLRYVLDSNTLTIVWKVTDPQTLCDMAKHKYDYKSFNALTRETFYTRASFDEHKVTNRKTLHISPTLAKRLSKQYALAHNSVWALPPHSLLKPLARFW